MNILIKENINMSGNQTKLFEIDKNEWEKDWVGMPEYNNREQDSPLITATFKFNSEEDYLKFKDLVQKHLYNGEKVFDGMQKIEAKSSWFPHKAKASTYEYI